jgi:hypothetical protein
MPRPASGRQRGRPRGYNWYGASRRWDNDWLVLNELLKLISERGAREALHLRSLIREVLSTNDRSAVARIEKKFWSLIKESGYLLLAKHVPITNEAIIERARDTLKSCGVYAGITQEELMRAKEAFKLLETIQERQKVFE